MPQIVRRRGAWRRHLHALEACLTRRLPDGLVPDGLVLVMSKRRFLIILALVAAFALCVPLDAKITPLLAKVLASSATVSIAGNSVLSHVSKCDQDSRSLPRMLADDIRRPVLDLSFPGQSIEEEATLAMASLRNRKIRTVVFPISLFELVDWDTEPVRIYVLSRLIGPKLHAAGLTERAASAGRFSGESHHTEAAFDYNGQHYPDYAHVKAAYFDQEKALMPCPENDGTDVKFITALYHHDYVEYPILRDDMGLISSLGKEAIRLRKSLRFVILPIDYELLEKLDDPSATLLRARVAELTAALGADGLEVIDLSASVPNGAFADRWCACGHLLAPGRAEVARRIAQHLSNSAPAIAAE